MLVAACGSAQSGAPASPAPVMRAPGMPVTTGPVPAATGQLKRSATSAPGSDRGALGRQYLAIAQAGNHHLETDFDGLRASHIDLATAAAYLRDAAATERLFDRRLLTLALPPAMETIARLLVTANEARAQLTVQAAEAPSLPQLRGYEPRLTAANGPVEEAVRVIRSMLGLPPPETS
jgi:hypothetical protein